MSSAAASDRTTVFCIHYLGGSRRTWGPVIEALADRLRIVPLDLPGFGEAAGSQFSVSAMAAAVSDSILASGARRWMLAGHSMGAKVAACVARSAEDGSQDLQGLVGLVMIAGSPPAPEPMEDSKRQSMLGWFRGDMDSKRIEAKEYIANNVGRPLSEHWQAIAVGDVLRADRRAWVAWLTSGSREDWTGRVGVLRTPTVIIAGAKDASLGFAAQQRLMAPHFERSKLMTIADAGHLLPLEQPEQVADVLFEHARSSVGS